MLELEEVIYYWKDRLLPHPPMTSKHWPDVVKDTISYLEQLQNLKKGA
ncbi:unnamed protein product [marine sediment metagenome]|uniref:Uncharacterized protein n=1 Tax=marine sediment metagenome TaxID=412755 RepID=X1P9P7_9ZZZZ